MSAYGRSSSLDVMEGGPPEPILGAYRSYRTPVCPPESKSDDEEEEEILDELVDVEVGEEVDGLDDDGCEAFTKLIKSEKKSHDDHDRDRDYNRKASLLSVSSRTSGTGGTRGISPQKRRSRQEQDPPGREVPADGVWPRRDFLSFTRSLVFYGYGAVTTEHEAATRSIVELRELRRKYHGRNGTKVVVDDGDDSGLQGDGITCRMGPNGVLEVFLSRDGDEDDNNNNNNNNSSSSTINRVQVPSIDDFVQDYYRLVQEASSGSMRSFCFQRLQLLTQAFKMHVTANRAVEDEAQTNLLGTDFYRTMKVDNHIHLAAAPSARLFASFVRRKLRTEGETVVWICETTGEPLTLKQVFERAGMTDVDVHLTIDAFSVMADYSVYQRFDNFNSKYSPFRQGNLRKIFLKTNNHIQGRYFAELTKMVMARHESGSENGHVSAVEMRVSIYGMERTEWLDLARWVLREWEVEDDDDGQRSQNTPLKGPVLSTHNRWLVQIPRLWRIYSSKPLPPVPNGHCVPVPPDTDNAEGGGSQPPPPSRSFQDMLENLFLPIVEATLHPDQHPEVAELLTHIVGFDSVDDEGALEEPCTCKRPHQWTDRANPSYAWQLYYLWANLEVVNRLREARGLNTFAFRPHAGETGDPMHLAATYLLCEGINHGINLDRQVSLQYLYYLDQVALSVSPLSNNFLFRKISAHPFKKLFERGLNVTLSTDDPLLFHMSEDALLEEYSVARASFDLSMTDICEIARNSVLQSGYDHARKQEWLGPNYRRGVTHHDEHKTHVPLIRAKYRAEHLALEHMLVSTIAAGKGKDVLNEMMVQFSSAREAHRHILQKNYLEVPPQL